MTEGATKVKDWALYVYFAANVPEAEVRAAAVNNLLQMATVGTNENVDVAAEIHLPGKWAYRYVMPNRPPGSDLSYLSPTARIPNVNSANPNTIVNFFEWAARTCPAAQTMLVVWGHGYGLDDYLPLGARPNTSKVPVGSDNLNQASSLPERVDDKLFIDDSKKAERAIPVDSAERILDARYTDSSLFNLGLDQSCLEVLPNGQLGAAIKRCKEILAGKERKLTILGIDACAMAMAEVWSEISQYAHLGIASEAQEPDASFPYDRFLARLLRDPDAGAELVAKMMVDAYVESYAYLDDAFVTLSCCDLERMDYLLDAVSDLATALTDAARDRQKRRIIFQARNDSPIFDPDGFMDLGRFCEILEITLADHKVEVACRKVRNALLGTNEERGRFVRYARYSPLDPRLRISQSTGLSVWFPPWLEDPFVGIPEQEASIAYLINGYGCTAFARKTHWDTFLKHMWHVGRECGETALRLPETVETER